MCKKRDNPERGRKRFPSVHSTSFQTSSKKRDNPERGRKQPIFYSVEISNSVKKEITPRGDGNAVFSFFSVAVILVKKEITPRGDGNPVTKIFSQASYQVKKEITPRGDGNILYCSKVICCLCKKRDNPERGRKLITISTPCKVEVL